MMNNDYNKVILSGEIETAPRLAYTADNTPVVNFVLNTRNKNRVDSFNITVWGELAKKVASEVESREKLLVEGFVQYRCYKKECVEARDSFEIVGKRIYSLFNDKELFV